MYEIGKANCVILLIKVFELLYYCILKFVNYIIIMYER
jgi:hypothetical protein